MKTTVLICWMFLITVSAPAQTVPAKLAKAYSAFRQDAQLAHASSSLYVIDASGGEVVIDRDSRLLLAPASTQKVIASVTAMELLGPSFRFATDFRYTGEVRNGLLNGDLVIVGSGDPTFGSWRYESTGGNTIVGKLTEALKAASIKQFEGSVFADDHLFESATVPGGWIWDDIGNYYGAGASALNWRENQYDLFFKPGKIGQTPEIIRTEPLLHQLQFVNELTTKPKGSGDNTYIYLAPYSNVAFLRGSVPMEDNFKASGSFPDPSMQTAFVFTEALKKAGYLPGVPDSYHGWSGDKEKHSIPSTLLYTHYSPTLDSIIYWFNKKSINLYGEALVKRLAADKNGKGTTEGGLAITLEFWKAKGIDVAELDMSDGSGLSPQDRLTTHAQVEVLKYAATRPWFKKFSEALPEYNGMKMKSGTIRKVKGFCGYHRSAAGRTYIFSFIVNNYSGASSSLVQKMYTVLDQLK